MKLGIFALLLVAFAAPAMPAAADPQLTGKWTIHYFIGGQEGDFACTFTQKEKDVAGSCAGTQGQATFEITGKLDGPAVTLQHKVEYNGDQLTLTYTGKAESAEKIAGSVSVAPIGVDGDFTLAPTK
ncbi:MAG: hypothetical protein IPP47_29295 [Bryobacterales bacterium]|nr:hypothetical protein [Bryobacterales bacterium]